MNVVVTGGGTIAPIDDVRHIANASSGGLSARITEACLGRGAEVWHVHAPSALLPFQRSARFNLRAADPEAECARLVELRRYWRLVRDRLHLRPLPTGTVADYARELRAVLQSEPIDLAFLAMAASDYEPVPVAGKIASGDEPLVIHCRPVPKVIQSVRDWAPEVYLIGFKLLSDVEPAELIRSAEEAARVNRADLIVANDFRTVREGRHALHLVRPAQPPETLEPGEDLAERLVERVFTWCRQAMAAHDPIPLDPSDQDPS